MFSAAQLVTIDTARILNISLLVLLPSDRKIPIKSMFTRPDTSCCTLVVGVLCRNMLSAPDNADKPPPSTVDLPLEPISTLVCHHTLAPYCQRETKEQIIDFRSINVACSTAESGAGRYGAAAAVAQVGQRHRRRPRGHSPAKCLCFNDFWKFTRLQCPLKPLDMCRVYRNRRLPFSSRCSHRFEPLPACVYKCCTRRFPTMCVMRVPNVCGKSECPIARAPVTTQGHRTFRRATHGRWASCLRRV
ncbi:hypothetical protein J6590_012986 [Homalodisca vitripennis]|nr:hypothetical protein J6590_012986 [Homalodisca vitripennis]